MVQPEGFNFLSLNQGFLQVEPESFITKPLIFGDFIHIEVPKEQKIYENYSNRYMLPSTNVDDV